MQIIGVEVFVRWGAGKQEVEQFQNQKLKRGLALTIEEKDDVLSKGLETWAVGRQDTDDFVRDLGCGRLGLVWGRVMGANHVLFIENELCMLSATSQLLHYQKHGLPKLV